VVEYLFGAPLHVARFGLSDEVRQRLITESLSAPSVTISNRGTWHSPSNLFDTDDAGCSMSERPNRRPVARSAVR
jgi:hypothetical protein